MLRGALRMRLVVVAAVLALFGGSLLLVPRLGLDLIPSFAQGEFAFRVELPQGTPIESTDRFLADVQSVLRKDPRIESWMSLAGGAGMSLTNTGSEGENVGRIQVRMDPQATRQDEQAVIARLRSRLEASELADFKFERPSYFSFRTPIEVEVYSDDLNELHAATSDVHESLQDIRGLVDLKRSSELGNPELQVSFDNDQLIGLGLDVGTVAATIRNKVQGEVATRFTQGDREIDILVRSVEMGQASIDDVRDMIIGQRDAVPIFLGSVAEVHVTEGPTEVRRIGQKRAAVISGNLDGRDMGAVATDIRSRLRSAELPGGVSVFLSGQEEEMSRSLRSLMLAMGLAIFLVYLVMASQFESFLHPFVIILSLPLGAVGVILALLATGRSINVVAMIGMVMLAGIVVNNAIVLVDSINRRRSEGLAKHEAIVEAGLGRLRPILMTSLTTILALLPMALGLGEGAELRSPLAITVIGGLAAATGLTLLVIPIVYSLVDRKVYAADAAQRESAAAGAPSIAAGELAG
jgi:HAE1 family hydrophobic/amphiphilic exporter-1